MVILKTSVFLYYHYYSSSHLVWYASISYHFLVALLVISIVVFFFSDLRKRSLPMPELESPPLKQQPTIAPSIAHIYMMAQRNAAMAMQASLLMNEQYWNAAYPFLHQFTLQQQRATAISPTSSPPNLHPTKSGKTELLMLNPNQAQILCIARALDIFSSVIESKL